MEFSVAESLLGMGDMLYLPPGSSHTVRVHGAFASALSQHKSNSESILFAAATATLKCMKTGGIYSIPKMNIVNKFIKKLKITKIK